MPETIADPEVVVLTRHSVPSHAIPTWEPVGQLLIKCQSPAPSMPLAPRHWEKSERRLSKSTFGVLQLTFQGIAGSAVVGHLMKSREARSQLCKGDDLRGVLDLKLDDSKADIEGALVSVSNEIKRNMISLILILCTRHSQYSIWSGSVLMHWLANRNGSHTRSRRRRPYKPEEREGMSET